MPNPHHPRFLILRVGSLLALDVRISSVGWQKRDRVRFTVGSIRQTDRVDTSSDPTWVRRFLFFILAAGLST